MKNLFQFIFKNIHWLLFGLLFFLSIFLIVNNNQFQRSKYLQAAHVVAGRVHSVSYSFFSYFYLKSINAELMDGLAELKTQVYAYQRQLADLTDNSEQYKSLHLDSKIYHFIQANVVKNSYSLHENYLMLNKGSEDGVEADMGVICANGIVGVIVNTTPHFSMAISLLNTTKFKPNGIIKHSHYFGPISWDGKDARYAYLNEIPRFVAFEPGDTVVTSGYSAVFPQGIPVGSIMDARKTDDDNIISLRIQLLTDFYRLNNVLIVANKHQKEQQELEERTLKMKAR